MPDEQHGDERYIVMQNIVDAAEADEAPIIQTWANMQETMSQVLVGKLKSKVWSPQR